jgi:hypothetical protein
MFGLYGVSPKRSCRFIRVARFSSCLFIPVSFRAFLPLVFILAFCFEFFPGCRPPDRHGQIVLLLLLLLLN